MRRINYLFMLVLMMCMSVATAQADNKRYVPEGYGEEAGAWTEGHIQEGVPCILQNALTTSYDVLCANQETGVISGDALYEFESAADKGEGLYRLKAHGTGLYVEDPVSSGTSGLTYTDSKARAFVFTVKD